MPQVQKVFPILALSVFAAALGFGIIIPLLPLYAESMGASGIWLALIYSSFSVSSVIMSPIAGRLSDSRGRKLIMAIGLLVCAFVSVGYSFAGSIAGLIVVRLLHGLASGMVLPVAQAYCGDIAPKNEEGKWMSYYNIATFTGFGFGPLMGGVLAEQLGMNGAFYAMAGFSLLAFLVVIFALPEIGRREKTAEAPLSFKQVAANKTMWGLFSYQMGASSSRGAFSTFLPVLAGIVIGLSTSQIGTLLTVQMLLASFLQLFTGRLADRINRRVLVITGSLLGVLAFCLFPSSGGFWLLLVVCVLLSIGDAVALSSAAAMAVIKGRELGMGMTMAVYSMMFSVGFVIGPIMAGAVADALNVRTVFYFGGVLLLIGTVGFGRLTAKKS